jgi:hypothetical protein
MVVNPGFQLFQNTATQITVFLANAEAQKEACFGKREKVR